MATDANATDTTDSQPPTDVASTTTDRICVVVDTDALDSDRFAVVAVQEPTTDDSDDWYAALGVANPATGPTIADLQGARVIARGTCDYVTSEVLAYVRDH